MPSSFDLPQALPRSRQTHTAAKATSAPVPIFRISDQAPPETYLPIDGNEFIDKPVVCVRAWQALGSVSQMSVC